MEVCLINFNKGEDYEGCLKFYNIRLSLSKSGTVIIHVIIPNTPVPLCEWNIVVLEETKHYV
jgi:hypothetical protein